MLDLVTVKTNADLLAICGSNTLLRRVAGTNGGEYAGACPFCGGKDRFRVQPNAKPIPLWYCRQCEEHWQSVLPYIAKRDNLNIKNGKDLAEICKRAIGCTPSTNKPNQRIEPRPRPAYCPPDNAWQRTARKVIDDCQENLWNPKYKRVLEYLLFNRGLSEMTIKDFSLGYLSTGDKYTYGLQVEELWIPRGIIIPCIVLNEVWYLKVRYISGIPIRCRCGAILANPGDCPSCGELNKYAGVKGNKQAALFNADTLLGQNAALFCEGEFDCMIAHQQLNALSSSGIVLPCVTAGSATNRLDLAAWGSYLTGLDLILTAYDTDTAGEKGSLYMETISNKTRRVELPQGIKDINELHQSGANLNQWIQPYLPQI